MTSPVTVFWFRRDLRLQDNAGLYAALQEKNTVLPVFIFDKNILAQLPDPSDRRVEFIHAALQELQTQLVKLGASLVVLYDTPENAFQTLLKTFSIAAVYTNHDYEPYATERDRNVEAILQEKNILFKTYKDQVIFEKKEVIKDDGKPYTVFTPYSRKWKAALQKNSFESLPSEKLLSQIYQQSPLPIPSLKEMGFAAVKKSFPSKELQHSIVEKYAGQRDIPSINGTSKLGVHLRFGTVSIRSIAREANGMSEVFLNELIWRDFYHMILWNFPQIARGQSFKPAYDHIEWRRDNGEFEKWCKGETGYPIVDAGMRELNETGFMHNRVRMITASFLCKHLLLDWRLGEAYFAEKLLDFDFAANNGGWQWAAGSGCDAAPYFRIFNPYLQTKKFDPENKYIMKWVPEFLDSTYPEPIVIHEIARKRCLEVYGNALKK